MNLFGGIYNYFEARRRRRQMETAVVFGIGCGAFIICGLVIVIVGSIMNAVESGNVQRLYGDYANACDPFPAGNADDDNMPDVSSPRPILLLIADAQRRHAWHSELPEQWRAENQDSLALIGCIEEETVTLETCEYERPASDGDGTFTVRVERQQHTATLVLINPDSSRIIDSLTVEGSKPDDCPDDARVSGEEEGSEVDWSDFAGWVEGYVFD